jgi:MFS family permease
MKIARTLRAEPEFRRLWSGQALSLVGTTVTDLAIPLTAAAYLHASAVEMGVLGAMEFMPWLLFGSLAGVWVDRLPRRRVMLTADLARAFVLLVVPVAAWCGVLHIWMLLAAAFLVGLGLVFFDSAASALLPGIVRPDAIMECNAALRLNQAVGWTAGPALGGWLVYMLTAPVALLADAASYLWSALFVRGISEPVHESGSGRRTGLWREMREGGGIVLRSPTLRSVILATAALSLANGMFISVYILFLNRDLGLNPALVAAPYFVFGLAAVAGSLAATGVVRRLGFGRTLIAMGLLNVVATVAMPLIAGRPFTLVRVVLPWVLSGFVTPVFGSTVQTLMQSAAPPRALGRVSATSNMLGWSCIPIGSLIGGVLGGQIGFRATLFAATAPYLAAPILLLFSPARSLTAPPVPPDEGDAEQPTAEAEAAR